MLRQCHGILPGARLARGKDKNPLLTSLLRQPSPPEPPASHPIPVPPLSRRLPRPFPRPAATDPIPLAPGVLSYSSKSARRSANPQAVAAASALNHWPGSVSDPGERPWSAAPASGRLTAPAPARPSPRPRSRSVPLNHPRCILPPGQSSHRPPSLFHRPRRLAAAKILGPWLLRPFPRHLRLRLAPLGARDVDLHKKLAPR